MLWCVVLIESSGFHLLAGKQIGRTAEAAKLVGSKKKDFFLGFYFGHISQSYRAWRNSPRCAKTTFVSVYFSNLIRKNLELPGLEKFTALSQDHPHLHQSVQWQSHANLIQKLGQKKKVQTVAYDFYLDACPGRQNDMKI
ncbi:uncharacterized protein [Lolium perenne]|uniref:uncharacterized protein isoform X4 n=1 Tax=Lolium perenne TaxID=4522 RepID=UPI003A99C620